MAFRSFNKVWTPCLVLCAVILNNILLVAYLSTNRTDILENSAMRRHLESSLHRSEPPTPPPHNHFCYVHIGKTAGSFLACKLGLGPLHHITCPNKKFQPNPESRLANKTDGFLHMYWSQGGCKDDQVKDATFLVSLRNPVDRIISWFYFERPKSKNATLIKPPYKHKKRLWLDCPYWQAQDLFEKGLRPLGKSEHLGIEDAFIKEMTCPQRAWAAVMGKRQFNSHNYFNNDYYYNWTKGLAAPKQPRIVAIRAEHLERDWNGLERSLGDRPGSTTLQGKLNEGTEKKDSHKAKKLSPQARLQVCWALCEEIKAYKKLLLLAENLSDHDRQTSLDELQASCPDLDIMSNREICPKHVPKIQKECVGPGSQGCNWWYDREDKAKKALGMVPSSNNTKSTRRVDEGCHSD